jgi:hypothetical protein
MRAVMLQAFLFVVALTIGCGGSPYLQTGAASAREIQADAPDGFRIEHLGVPLDATFTPMIGGGAVSLFPQAGRPTCAPMGGWSSEQRIVETDEELNANARAWGIVDAHAQFRQGHRFAYYRAKLLTAACQINDTTPMIQPPPGAVYYASRFFVGHSYSTVIDGDSSRFSAGVSAEFLHYGGGVDGFKQRYGLNASGKGKGLEPTGPISLFSQPQQVAQNYRMSRQPDAIVIVYRQIPGAQVNVAPVAARATTVDFRFTGLNVTASGSSLHDYSNWDLSAYCNLNGQPFGAPVEIMKGTRVGSGANQIAFSRQIPARDNDNIECFVEGRYTRGSWGFTSTHSMQRATTGLLVVGRLPAMSSFPGGDGTANFSISWSATKLP